MPPFWAQRSAAGLALWPLSLGYRALVAVRRWLYRTGWRARTRLPVPVIVVGNVVAGGAGKTPVVIALVQHLQARGLRPGVVSRGYGRRSQGTQHVQADSSAHTVGDEPLLVARRCAVPVAVSERRGDAGRALLARHPDTDVIVSDDGLQHLALARDIELCVFGAEGVGNGWLLPAGPLREPWPRAVDFLLCAGAVPPGGSAPTFALERRLADTAIAADGRRVPLADLAGQALVAVAGTARPEEFFAMLRARGLAPTQTFALPDHFDFDTWNPNTDKRQRLVCTEKDAPKLWPRFPDALAVPLELAIAPAFFAALDERLAQTAQRPLSSPARPPG